MKRSKARRKGENTNDQAIDELCRLVSVSGVRGRGRALGKEDHRKGRAEKLRLKNVRNSFSSSRFSGSSFLIG